MCTACIVSKIPGEGNSRGKVGFFISQYKFLASLLSLHGVSVFFMLTFLAFFLLILDSGFLKPEGLGLDLGFTTGLRCGSVAWLPRWKWVVVLIKVILNMQNSGWHVGLPS